MKTVFQFLPQALAGRRYFLLPESTQRLQRGERMRGSLSEIVYPNPTEPLRVLKQVQNSAAILFSPLKPHSLLKTTNDTTGFVKAREVLAYPKLQRDTEGLRLALNCECPGAPSFEFTPLLRQNFCRQNLNEPWKFWLAQNFKGMLMD